MDDIRFERILSENKERIHFHIHHLHIYDGTGEYYAVGQEALWQAALTHDEKKGAFSTYANWKIRNALIDSIRKLSRQQDNDQAYRDQKTEEECCSVEDYMVDHELWEQVKGLLSDNQWKWVTYFIIKDYSVEQIAALEGVSRDAVKNWGRHARRKLKEGLRVE
ncbi:sigma-70 family RNA polymerase sigma factor [Halobacillus salinus]|uniref:sigma-70 family RNA polymerase sigma factor n=1 Tax=Halobacillus salinus TaxID=192814 RepID=UPI0009A629C3|nr:sigma-70 family RNA polymerase sigma factor [Halobacillus salinus]